MKIHKFTHGRDDAELFSKVGRWCVAPSVHRRLGIAVTSQPDDIWLVIDSGFLQMRKKSNGDVHIRFLYVEDEKDTGAQSSLVEAAIRECDQGAIIFTNDKKDSKMWKRLKFSAGRGGRGNYCRWERKVK